MTIALSASTASASSRSKSAFTFCLDRPSARFSDARSTKHGCMMSVCGDAKTIERRGEIGMDEKQCAHYVWNFSLSRAKQEATCTSCGTSLDVRAVAAFHSSTESEKTMNPREFRQAALKLLGQRECASGTEPVKIEWIVGETYITRDGEEVVCVAYVPGIGLDYPVEMKRSLGCDTYSCTEDGKFWSFAKDHELDIVARKVAQTKCEHKRVLAQNDMFSCNICGVEVHVSELVSVGYTLTEISCKEAVRMAMDLKAQKGPVVVTNSDELREAAKDMRPGIIVSNNSFKGKFSYGKMSRHDAVMHEYLKKDACDHRSIKYDPPTDFFVCKDCQHGVRSTLVQDLSKKDGIGVEGVARILMRGADAQVAPSENPIKVLLDILGVDDLPGAKDAREYCAQDIAAHVSGAPCDHLEAMWVDDKKIVVCKTCSIDLAEVYGRYGKRSRREKEDCAQACAARDGLTRDNRRPRTDLRTDAQRREDEARANLLAYRRGERVDWQAIVAMREDEA